MAISGFYLGWAGGLGRGRAISVGQVEFSGRVLPDAKFLRLTPYETGNFEKLVLGIADGEVLCDGESVFRQKIFVLGYSDQEYNYAESCNYGIIVSSIGNDVDEVTQSLIRCFWNYKCSRL